ncbi:hypothetical protein ACN9MH_17285 [Paenibacillus silvae]|uniref:hypothetical protein n=1 Tax=Paenibacillus silvae TaxID=1325358 RepID=UPI003CF9676A
MVITIETTDYLFENSVELADFSEPAQELTLAERRTIVDQALVLLDTVYVHMPLKKSMYAINPVQRLKILRRQI